MEVPIIWSWYIPEDFEKAEFHHDLRSIAYKSLFRFKIFLIRMKNGKILFSLKKHRNVILVYAES